MSLPLSDSLAQLRSQLDAATSPLLTAISRNTQAQVELTKSIDKLIDRIEVKLETADYEASTGPAPVSKGLPPDPAPAPMPAVQPDTDPDPYVQGILNRSIPDVDMETSIKAKGAWECDDLHCATCPGGVAQNMECLATHGLAGLVSDVKVESDDEMLNAIHRARRVHLVVMPSKPEPEPVIQVAHPVVYRTVVALPSVDDMPNAGPALPKPQASVNIRKPKPKAKSKPKKAAPKKAKPKAKGKKK